MDAPRGRILRKSFLSSRRRRGGVTVLAGKYWINGVDSPLATGAAETLPVNRLARRSVDASDFRGAIF